MKISVIIPTLSRPEDLLICLNAIAKNTRQPDEVIIVEQGDVEKTRQIANKCILPIEVIFLSIKSSSKARNTGFEMCNGDVIAYIDDDVEIADNYLEVAEQYFSDSKNDSVLGIVGKDLVRSQQKKRLTDYMRQIVGVLFCRSTFGNKSVVLISGQNVLRNIADKQQSVEWIQGVGVWRRTAFQNHQYDERMVRWCFGEDVMFSYQHHYRQPGCLWYVPELNFFHNESQVNRIFNVQATRMMIIYRYIFWKECIYQDKLVRVFPYVWSQLGFSVIEIVAHPSKQTVRTLYQTYKYLWRNRIEIECGVCNFNEFIFK